MTPAELLDCIPEIARYHRIPVADEENALFPWQQAIGLVHPGDDDDIILSELIYGTDDGQPAPIPTGKEFDRISRLLESNQAAFDLADEGVRRGRFQFPELTDFKRAFDGVFGTPYDLMSLSQMLVINVKFKMAAGKWDDAVGELINQLRMGELLCNGDGIITSYMLGVGYRRKGTLGILRLLEEHSVSGTLHRRLSQAVEKSLEAEDGLAQSERVDLCCYTIPRFATVDEKADLETLVDQILDMYYDSQTMADLDPEDCADTQISDETRQQRLQTRRRQILEILDSHPYAFDMADTMRVTGSLLAERIEFADLYHREREFGLLEFLAKRTHTFFRDRRLNKATRYWPGSLTPNCSLDHFGDDPQAIASRQFVKSHMPEIDFSELEPATPAQLKQAKTRLRRIKNPLGLILQSALCSIDVRHFVAEHRENLWAIQEKLRSAA